MLDRKKVGRNNLPGNRRVETDVEKVKENKANSLPFPQDQQGQPMDVSRRIPRRGPARGFPQLTHSQENFSGPGRLPHSISAIVLLPTLAYRACLSPVKILSRAICPCGHLLRLKGASRATPGVHYFTSKYT